MRLLSNLQVKGKPAVLPDREIRSQSHYFIYRPCSYFRARRALHAISRDRKTVPKVSVAIPHILGRLYFEDFREHDFLILEHLKKNSRARVPRPFGLILPSHE